MPDPRIPIRRTAAFPGGAMRATGVLLACATLCACGRSAPREPFAHLDLENGGAETSYQAPPRVLDAVAARDGATLVSGRAASMAPVVLSTPEGETFQSIANAQGIWNVRLPPSALPRLFAISSRQDGRAVHAEGALVTVPHAHVPAVLVRAGYAALPIGAAAKPDIVSIDYDPGTFAGVSGVAAPGAPVRLSVDGLPAGVTRTDAQGRFAVLAVNRPLGFGAHVIEAATPAGVVRRTVEMTTPTTLARPYVASGAPGSWTVEWALNGGGLQTTLIVAAPRA